MRPRIILDSPAADFNESFLLGNGSLGAAVHGNPSAERIDLNRDTFWSGGPGALPAAPPDPAERLAAIRAAIRDERWADAEAVGASLQSDQWTQSYQPIGYVQWQWRTPYAADGSETADGSKTANGYERRLDLGDAIATVQLGDSASAPRLTAFVSAPADVVVVEATLDPADDSEIWPEFVSPHPVHRLADGPGGESLEVRTWGGRAPENVIPQYVDDHPDPVRYADDAPDADGLVDRGMGFAVAIGRQRTAAGTVRLLIAVVDGFRGRTERPSADLEALRTAAVGRVLQAAQSSTDELRSAHIDDHRSWFDRVDVDLEDARDALAFHNGRYLLMASSRPGSQPSNLQGIWNADVRPGWSANHTININTQMLYWPAFRTGLGPLARPLVDLAVDLAALGQRTARDFYAADGWTAHHNTDLWGFTAPVHGGGEGDSAWSNFPTAGVWIAVQTLEELDWNPEARHDPELLGSLWTIARGAARFVLDLLRPDADGLLVVTPSTSPEHRFVTEDGGASSFTAGSAIDQELARDLLTRLPSVAPAAPDTADAALLAEASSALASLRPTTIGDDGAIAEWDVQREPVEPGHRHLSHLYGLFPGRAFAAATDSESYEAAIRALDQRVAAGSGYTGWSQSWILCLAARTGNAELVAHSLDVLREDLASVSLLDLHPVGGFDDRSFLFQQDGNAGLAAGVAEALVDGSGGTIRLLPAAPDRWGTGSFRGLRTHGGHAVDAVWDRDGLQAVTIVLGSDDTVRLVVPAGSAQLVAQDGATRVGEAVDSATAQAVTGRAGDRFVFVRAASTSGSLGRGPRVG